MTTPPQITPWYVACAVILVAPLLLVPAILFTSAFYSLRWAVMMSGAIARERESGMFDLIAVSPAGAFGTSWAISTASIHRNHSLEQIQSLSSWVVRLAFLMVVLASLDSFVDPIVPFNTNGALLAVIPLVYLATLVAAMYVDHVQSVVLGTLVGILVPTYTRSRIDAGAGAFLVFLLLQVTTYALTLLVGFYIIPTSLNAFTIPPVVVALVLPFLRLGVFYLVREAAITILWRSLVERLNVAASEMESMAHG